VLPTNRPFFSHRSTFFFTEVLLGPTMPLPVDWSQGLVLARNQDKTTFSDLTFCSTKNNTCARCPDLHAALFFYFVSQIESFARGGDDSCMPAPIATGHRVVAELPRRFRPFHLEHVVGQRQLQPLLRNRVGRRQGHMKRVQTRTMIIFTEAKIVTGKPLRGPLNPDFHKCK
jgi:hypothetical protein